MADQVGSLQQLVDALLNENFKSYVYIGSPSSDAWALAKSAQLMLAGVRVFCVPDPQLGNQVRAQYQVAAKFVGIVFGLDDTVKQTLLQAEADDFLALTTAIANA